METPMDGFKIADFSIDVPAVAGSPVEIIGVLEFAGDLEAVVVKHGEAEYLMKPAKRYNHWDDGSSLAAWSDEQS